MYTLFTRWLIAPLLVLSAAYAWDPTTPLAPTTPSLLLKPEFKEAERKIAAGLFEEAENYFLQLRAEHPEDPWVPVRLGDIYILTGRLNEARELLLRARGQSYSTVARQVLCETMMGDQSEAEWQQSLALLLRHSSMELGLPYLARPEDRPATLAATIASINSNFATVLIRPYLDMALRLGPENPYVRYVAGRLLLDTDIDASREHLEAVVETGTPELALEAKRALRRSFFRYYGMGS